MAVFAFMQHRLGRTDGVSLEVDKWRRVLEGMGHTVHYFAGNDVPPRRSLPHARSWLGRLSAHLRPILFYPAVTLHEGPYDDWNRHIRFSRPAPFHCGLDNAFGLARQLRPDHVQDKCHWTIALGL